MKKRTNEVPAVGNRRSTQRHPASSLHRRPVPDQQRSLPRQPDSSLRPPTAHNSHQLLEGCRASSLRDRLAPITSSQRRPQRRAVSSRPRTTPSSNRQRLEGHPASSARPVPVRTMESFQSAIHFVPMSTNFSACVPIIVSHCPIRRVSSTA